MTPGELNELNLFDSTKTNRVYEQSKHEGWIVLFYPAVYSPDCAVQCANHEKIDRAGVVRTSN
jgi:hypothetical protein